MKTVLISYSFSIRSTNENICFAIFPNLFFVVLHSFLLFIYLLLFLGGGGGPCNEQMINRSSVKCIHCEIFFFKFLILD